MWPLRGFQTDPGVQGCAEEHFKGWRWLPPSTTPDWGGIVGLWRPDSRPSGVAGSGHVEPAAFH